MLEENTSSWEEIKKYITKTADGSEVKIKEKNWTKQLFDSVISPITDIPFRIVASLKKSFFSKSNAAKKSAQHSGNIIKNQMDTLDNADIVNSLIGYMDSASKYKYDNFWIGFIDIDEFIVPIYKNSLKEILKEYEQYGGVGINWCVYGSSNRKDKPNGLVIKNFKYRAKDDFVANIHIKTIANPRYIKRFKNPHQILCKYSKKIVSPNFQILNNFYNNEIDYSKIRIKHYYTKSKEEFLIKIKKGKADDKSEKKLSDFEAHDKNDIYDNIMDKYIKIMEN